MRSATALDNLHPKVIPLSAPRAPQILVNGTRREMSPKIEWQIYRTPDVPDLQPLFNLQIPTTWRSSIRGHNL